MRQLDIFDPTKYQAKLIVIGAGGIGGPTILQAAKLGIEDIHVIDFDQVTDHNQPNQLFGPQHVGQSKCLALKEIIKTLTGVDIKYTETKITDDSNFPFEGVVVAAVDSIDARRTIFEKVKMNPNCRLLLDGRIGGEILALYAINPLDLDQLEKYEEEALFPASESAKLPCTARAIADVGFFIGAFIARAIRKFLVNESDIKFETIFDVKNGILMQRS